MPGNNSGRRQSGNSAVPYTVGRPDVDGFWMGDYGGGGPGKPPCWRTLKESCKGLGSVSLKINHQNHPNTPHTYAQSFLTSNGTWPISLCTTAQEEGLFRKLTLGVFNDTLNFMTHCTIMSESCHRTTPCALAA
jgi:hypothetical protein